MQMHLATSAADPAVAFPGTHNRKYKNTRKIHGDHGKTMEKNQGI